MNPRRIPGILLIFAAVIASTVAVAYSQMGAERNKGRRLYNLATETTVKGTVEEVKTISSPRGWGGTHLGLKTESGTFDVHLGPSAFLTKKNFTFAKGDRVEAIGSKVKYHGHDAIIAREVKMGGKVLTLRDAQGIPEWSGGRLR
jgi:DNA/RNA endonuclease YhcR with UshA esterase domain